MLEEWKVLHFRMNFILWWFASGVLRIDCITSQNKKKRSEAEEVWNVLNGYEHARFRLGTDLSPSLQIP